MAGGDGKSVVAALAVAFFLLAAFASGLSTGDATSGRGTSGGGGSGAARLRQAPPSLAPRSLGTPCRGGVPAVGEATVWLGSDKRREEQRFGGGDGVFSPPTATRAVVAEMELYDLTGGCAERGLHGDGELPGPRRGKALSENLCGEEERVRGRGGLTRRVARAGAVEDVERRKRSADEEAEHSVVLCRELSISLPPAAAASAAADPHPSREAPASRAPSFVMLLPPHPVSNAQENNVTYVDSSSEESEDVKICDICGDVGEEKKLAICSSYCMRVMMQEVPKAKWLCETCHSEVESEKRKNKIETSESKVGGSKGPMNKPSSSENGVDAENVGSNMSNRGNEMNSVNKRKDGDAGITSLVRQNPVSRESSFKLDGKKGNDPAGHGLTLQACNQRKLYTPSFNAGQLSKSTSFNNSKVPKVKQLLNEVPEKPKTFKDSLSTPMRKEGPMGILAKSASFKKPKCFEPVNKAKPSTVMNPLVSENARNDILTSILGSCSLTGSVTVPVHSKAQSSAQHLNKGNRMADSNILGTSGGEGHCGIKKPPHTKGHANIGMLGSGAQKKTIQVPDSSHLDDQIKSPSSLVPSNSSSVSIPGSASLRDHQTVPSMRGRSVDSISAMSKDMKEKKLMFSSQNFSPSCKHIASTIPELDYIWRGGFELSRTVRSPVLCEGLQAHLSCFASPKVLEVAKKFPSNVQLEELPRQNLWPPQFHDNGPTIDSIALFFFARDTESYEIHYRKLVENMLKDDLALRGNIETAELLIFASNTLPNNFQRWNMFHFLWGVFRGCLNGVKSLFHPLVGNPLDGQSHDSITAMFPTNNSSAIDDFLPVPTRKDLKLAYSEQKEKMGYPSEGNGCDVNFDVNMKLNTCSFSVIHGKGNESTNNKMDNAEHLMDGDSVNATGVSSSNVHTISHVNGGVRKRSVDVANWDDKVNGRPQHKKIKLDDGGSVSCAHAFMARKELSKMQQCLRSVGKMSRTKPS
uniref:AIPP2-like SPOC-like domain-containing protein n=1 Tax=Oryza meridionalis TaxID=40149 RepID=A0A0E0F4T5_9ORYZ